MGVMVFYPEFTTGNHCPFSIVVTVFLYILQTNFIENIFCSTTVCQASFLNTYDTASILPIVQSFCVPVIPLCSPAKVLNCVSGSTAVQSILWRRPAQWESNLFPHPSTHSIICFSSLVSLLFPANIEMGDNLVAYKDHMVSTWRCDVMICYSTSQYHHYSASAWTMAM